jgi:hypothetical protein
VKYRELGVDLMVYDLRKGYLEACSLIGDKTDMLIIGKKLSDIFKWQRIVNIPSADNTVYVWPLIHGRVNGHMCYLLKLDMQKEESVISSIESSVAFICLGEQVVLINNIPTHKGYLEYLKSTCSLCGINLNVEYVYSDSGLVVVSDKPEKHYSDKYLRYEAAFCSLLQHSEEHGILDSHMDYFDCGVFCSSGNIYIEYMKVRHI